MLIPNFDNGIDAAISIMPTKKADFPKDEIVMADFKRCAIVGDYSLNERFMIEV
ncbi:MAG TPA: hypothetical protein PLG57_06690 [Bacteroidia bacterium]|nr:hypothetical protein [Bacteroidia bacterium]HQF28861.1 hypothetical protein [Bacteroidia bacterium]HQK98215.1 hypothetical protein [Bacteroidia bacterium]